MKKILKIVLSLFVIFSLIIVSGIFYLSRGLNTGENIKLNGVDLQNIEDGVYEGDYQAGRWSNKLAVVVKNNKIMKIDIKDDVTFMNSAVTKEVFNKVIKAQDTRVDTVTGATVTSKAYLKAIENGLSTD